MDINLYIAYSARCSSLMKFQTLLQHSNVFWQKGLFRFIARNILRFQHRYQIHLSHCIFTTCLIAVKQNNIKRKWRKGRKVS